MKRTWKKHYIGLAVPQSMVIEMDNTIWQSFMKMQSEWKEISNRLSIGIDLLHCKTMIWQSRNAKNLELHCNYASQYNQQFVNFQFDEEVLYMKKSISRIIGVIMLIVAIVFIVFALNHPEMSFPWNNTITWLLYGLYILVTVMLLIAPKTKK